MYKKNYNDVLVPDAKRETKEGYRAQITTDSPIDCIAEPLHYDCMLYLAPFKLFSVLNTKCAVVINVVKVVGSASVQDLGVHVKAVSRFASRTTLGNIRVPPGIFDQLTSKSLAIMRLYKGIRTVPKYVKRVITASACSLVRNPFLGSGMSQKATDAATSKPHLCDVLTTFIPASSGLSNDKTEVFSTDDERTASFLSIFSTTTPALSTRNMKKKDCENY
uniref:Uncharacterized protein n=1 Tax=Glossina austeni TaxID=7395 RepID=A0A1A9VL87_GLOAU